MPIDQFTFQKDSMPRMVDAIRNYTYWLHDVVVATEPINGRVNHCGPDTMAWEGSAAAASQKLEDAINRLRGAISELDRIRGDLTERINLANGLAGGQNLPSGSHLTSTGVAIAGTLPPVPRAFTTHVKAEDVPLNDTAIKLYFRYGDKENTILSDCTWYAAEAVYIESGKKINIGDSGLFSTWGNATDWAANAEKYAAAHPDGPVTGVNGTPRPGDVIWFSYGHVAFVEGVEWSADGKSVRITLSEENAYGNAIGDGQQVGNMRRWRRTVEYRIVPGSKPPAIDNSGVRFIHFRY